MTRDAVRESAGEPIPAHPAPAVVVPGFDRRVHVSRRRLLVVSCWTALGAMAFGSGAAAATSLYPRGVPRLTGKHVVGHLDALAPGTKEPIVVEATDPRRLSSSLQARIHLVRLDAEQAARNPGAKPGMVYAFWRKCAHLGCTVPWNPTFSIEDPRSRQTYSGWFRCRCHGSTYSDAGFKVFGPAPRSLDLFPLTIGGDGKLIVDVGTVITRSGEDPARGVLRA